MKNPKINFKNAIGNLVLLIVVLVILEVFLRVLNLTDRRQDEILYPISWDEQTHKDYTQNSFFIRRPGKGDEFEEVENYINSNGIRGEEVPAKSKRRILSLGDSFVQAEEVEFKKTFGELLNARHGDSIEFISHGISSWAPTPIFSWIINKGEVFQPDNVYLFLCINDFFRVSVYPDSDAYYRSQAIYEDKLPVAYIDNRSYVKNALLKVVANIELIRLPVTLYKLAKQNASQGQDESGHAKHGPLTTELQILDKQSNEWPSDVMENVNLTLDVIANMNDYLSEKNIDLDVIIVPLGFAWDDECEKGKISYGLKEDETLKQRGFEEYVKYVLVKGFTIPTHSLSLYFDEYKSQNPSVKLHFTSDGHWNNNGHALVADIISKNMLN